MLQRLTADEVAARTARPFDSETLSDARRLVEAVQTNGETKVREQAECFGEIKPNEPLVADRKAFFSALETLDSEARGVLERTAERIRSFAEAQRDCLDDLDTPIPGGRAGHTISALDVAGCYAPGGRYPLPSSVLMTVIPARVAGVEKVILATPSRDPIMYAAAAVADADMLLRVGGAHAIAAMAYGVGVPACDIIVGPGNRWVTAAKYIVSSTCSIDMLAGPSELVVIADETANSDKIVADLLAQSEHDVDAVPGLVATSPGLVDRVCAEIDLHLTDLKTSEVARTSLALNGWACVVDSMEQAVLVSDAAAPEHVAVFCKDAPLVASKLRHAGAVFIGEDTAEVFGDYGAGPNHTLPTGRTARFRGGLSVLDFLRVRTWLHLDGAGNEEAVEDAVSLGRMEGLEAHARSAALRRR